jgi:hypothetical protein
LNLETSADVLYSYVTDNETESLHTDYIFYALAYSEFILLYLTKCH